LNESFEWLQKNYPEISPKIFASIVDIQINFLYLHVDSVTSGGYSNVINREYAIRTNSGSELPLNEAIATLIKIHHADTAFCLRYRAIWDKIMGLCFLLYCPEKYEQYNKAKSKIKFFTNNLSNNSDVKNLINNYAIVGSLQDFLREFEEGIRTPEIHGTGVLRKYAFNIDPEKRINFGMSYWNPLNEVVLKIGNLMRVN
jgi:hypothetical protein